MKHVIEQLRNIPFKKEIFPLLLLTTFSLALWFGGPLIAIANAVPLEQPQKRFYLILLLFIAWALKIYFLDSKSQTVVDFPPANPELDKKVKTLTEKFEGFIGFLNKTIISKDGHDVSLNQLPWYLFIGPENAGKTTLLANANVNFLLAKKFKPEHLKGLAPSKACDWWVTRDMVLVDVPGSYLHAKPKTANSSLQAAHSNKLWRTLLTLISKYRGRHALQGIVIGLSLSDLLNQQKAGLDSSFNLKHYIHELSARFGAHLPFHFIIMKCDVLPGFTEFFSDSGIDELSQAWGITVPPLKESESLTDIFAQRFNSLIKRLNKQLISRLHQERNPLTRPQIKDFPLHIERLKECLITFLRDVSSTEKHFRLQGVYLTSAIQQHPEEHLVHLYTATTASVSKTMPAIHTMAIPSRPYFVRQLLLQGFASIFPTMPTNAKKWQHRPVIYLVSALFTLLVAGVIGNDFRASVKQTSAIRTGLIQYQSSLNQQNPDLVSALPLLNALEKRATTSAHSWLFHSAKAKNEAATAYQDALQNIIFTAFKTHFETYLQTTDYKNPVIAYSVLKAYLELGDKQYFQPDFVINTLKQISPATLVNPDTDTILKHINAAFAHAQPVMLDDQMITNVRKHIASLSPVNVAFIILKNLADNNTQVVLPLNSSNEKDKIQISKMYTGDYFQNIYDRQVETAALELVQGNWVLGNNILSPAQQNFASMSEQLRNMYVAAYVSVWESLLVNTKLTPPNTLDQADTMAAHLMGQDSPLAELLKIIKHNTQFAPITSVSTKLAALDNLQNNSLNTIALTLRQLHTDLQKILSAHNPSNAAFQAAAERFQDHRNQSADPITQLHVLARNNPEPIKSWLNSIATQTWRFTLQDAGHYAENHWQTDVMSAYRSQFENHYPLWSDAKIETPIDQFAKFLNPNGTLNNYFENFLAPFVESKDKRWQWKKMDDEQIPFSDVALQQITAAQVLQPIFFPDNNNQIFVKFTLQPLSLAASAQSVSLNINGQVIQYDRSQPHIPQSLVWPGSKMAHETVVDILSRSNHSSNNKLDGSWGWFRLVNQSTTKILNPHELLLNFTVGGHEAKYYLFTKGTINPFLALQKIRLPEQLEDKA